MNIQISNKIGEIVSKSNCSTYVITGYKHLKTRLVLNFDDCKQVFDFWDTEDGYEVKMFYTKDFSISEKLDDMKSFKELHNKEQPEFDDVTN